MAFFPRNFYNGNDASASFTPLFRLLDDFDSYSRQTGGTPGRRSGLPQWQPKFDVREVAEAYELHGELPGVTKENVSIEFTEPQTMVVRGKVERTYTAGTSPHAASIEDTAMSGAIAEKAEEQPKGSPRQATVEDEVNSESHESGFEQVVATKKPQKTADKAKYWLTERSIGEFSRSFNFPTRVDQDNVSASFKDGVLSIVVPKAKKHEARRIAIN
jgi:HSP20 family molecular chaperone IbpA